MIFKDRKHAGEALAAKLIAYANRSDVLVLGLPRGGVPVAFEVAKALNAPLDIFAVRKLGLPGYEELAMGAIASGGARVLNDEVVRSREISPDAIETVALKEQQELERRERLYRDSRPFPDVRGRTVILVDDGLATGATMRAAVVALQQLQPASIVVAAPISAPETCSELSQEVSEIVCAETPSPFMSVGLWYENFSQTTDDEVCELLAKAASRGQPEAIASPS